MSVPLSPLHGSLRHFDIGEIELQGLFNSGHFACPGCGEAQGIKFLLNALGPDAMMVTLPSCLTVIAGNGTNSAFNIPVLNMMFAAGAAAASGLSRALRLRGDGQTTVCVLGGDGGTFDIGLQAISGAAERNENVLYVCLNNEGYMNTGAQKSSASPLYASTGSTPAGKPTPKKNMMEIMAAHMVPYAATATVAFPDDLQRKVRKARSIQGFKYLEILTPCLPGWGMADSMSARSSRLAVETRYFPLYEVENGVRYTINHMPQGLPVERFLEVQGRFRHLTREQIREIQADVDRRWELLQARAAIGERFSPASPG